MEIGLAMGESALAEPALTEQLSGLLGLYRLRRKLFSRHWLALVVPTFECAGEQASGLR